MQSIDRNSDSYVTNWTYFDRLWVRDNNNDVVLQINMLNGEIYDKIGIVANKKPRGFILPLTHNNRYPPVNAKRYLIKIN